MIINKKIFVMIMIAASVLAGFIGFQLSRYTASYLVLDVNTLEMGERQLHVKNAETGTTETVRFIVGDNTGVDSFYSIELPSIKPASIHIPPLSSEGRFQINKITLAFDQISYIWNNHGECTQKTMVDGKIHRETCNSSSPALTTHADKSLTIIALPSQHTENSLKSRVVLGLCSGLAVLLCGLWILRPYGSRTPPAGTCEYLSRSTVVFFVFMYAYQFYCIWNYTIDIPFWEEWKYYFEPDGLIDGLTLKWLFSFWDFHKVVFTKLVAWLSLKLTDLDFALQKRINYLVFGGLLFAIFRFKERLLGKGDFPLFTAFMLYLLSPIAFANHAVAQMSQTHFVILFAVLALNYAISTDNSIKSAIIFCVFVIAAMFSYSHGLAFTAVYLGSKTCYTVFSIARKSDDRKTAVLSLLLCYVLIALGLYFWFSVGEQAIPQWPLLYPVDALFWECWVNLVGLGFGFREEGLLSGVICLLITLLPCVLLFTKSDTRWKVATWQIATAILGILAALGAICVGRGSLAGTFKSSRYAEFAFLLIPYASLAWWLALKNVKWRGICLAGLWIFCLIAYRDDWNTSLVYRDARQMDENVLECIENYAHGVGDGMCPDTNWEPIGKYYDRAKKYGVNFTRQFR